MRYFWIGFICLIGFSSCDKDENLPFELTSEGLVGKWELYQYEGSDGSVTSRTEYEPSGKTVTFFPDGELISHGFFRCTDGEYKVADLTLTVFFDCEDQGPEQTYSMTKEGQNLAISPVYPARCRERCAYIFKKIE